MTLRPEVARLPFNGTGRGLILPSRTITNAGEWFNFTKKEVAGEVKMLPPLRGSTWKNQTPHSEANDFNEYYFI